MSLEPIEALNLVASWTCPACCQIICSDSASEYISAESIRSIRLSIELAMIARHSHSWALPTDRTSPNRLNRRRLAKRCHQAVDIPSLSFLLSCGAAFELLRKYVDTLRVDPTGAQVQY